MRSRPVAVLGLGLLACTVHAESNPYRLTIPNVVQGPERQVTTTNVGGLRRVERLEVSPDGRRFALFVRQGDAESNKYRSAWIVGRVDGDQLFYAGDGGELKPGDGGDSEAQVVRWSPNGQWVAYTRRQNGKVQLWSSRIDGGGQEQITQNAADVQEFAWSEDGQILYFTVGASRADLRAYDEEKQRTGYQYDRDLYGFSELLGPSLPRHPGNIQGSRVVWLTSLRDRRERLATELESRAFEVAHERDIVGRDSVQNAIANASVPAVRSTTGALAWLVRSSASSFHSRLMVRSSVTSTPIVCREKECVGRIKRVWWSENGQRVMYLRTDGLGSGPYGGAGGRGIYSWSPDTGVVSTVLYTFDYLQHCNPAAREQLICVRETATTPPHVVTIDLASGTVRVLVDLNPEFRNIRLGRADRFEWETPEFHWSQQGGRLRDVYSSRAFGYILYPSGFDPAKRYPVIIDPYVATGFESSVGAEHALHVYAANGFVVLNTQFPQSGERASVLLGKGFMSELYSAELDFPHMTMYAESTVRALKVVAARGFVDERRVGIGGVSHGTFIPLYIVQKHDLIAAISVSSQTWGAHNCYSASRMGRESMGAWITQPDCERQEYWSQIDVADHVDSIEAPILMNLPAAEAPGMARLLRHLSDAGKPYDAYLFPYELHQKWQPTHLNVIQDRNLDWFSFWLQGHEDPSPVKAEQYAYWRELQMQQHKSNRARLTQIAQ